MSIQHERPELPSGTFEPRPSVSTVSESVAIDGPSPLTTDIANLSDEEKIERLTAMGFPHIVVKNQLHLSHGDMQDAAEHLVHLAHGPHSGAKGDPWGHPDCPVCMRESHNADAAQARHDYELAHGHGVGHAIHLKLHQAGDAIGHVFTGHSHDHSSDSHDKDNCEVAHGLERIRSHNKSSVSEKRIIDSQTPIGAEGEEAREPTLKRRGSVRAMLRRPSIQDRLGKMADEILLANVNRNPSQPSITV